jgi:hypothetical protein
MSGMTTDKETVYAALFSRLSMMTGMNTKSRRVKHYDEVPQIEQPSMMMEQTNVEIAVKPGSPSKQTIRANVVLYAFDDSETGPMPAINGLVKQVEDLMKQQPGETTPWKTTTLSGSVYSAQVTSIDFSGGNVGTQGVAVVGIEMLTAQ